MIIRRRTRKVPETKLCNRTLSKWIIIMSRCQHRYPWPSLATRFYRSLLPGSLQGYILLYIGSSWSSYLCSSMWRGPQEYVTYELVPMLYSRNTNTNISGNIIKHNLRTSMNERTHFFIKYISHTLFSKGLMFLWCVRDGWTDLY